ncbi:MAG: ferrous iron transport protein B [Sedimentisphaerales bacterium]|nr:ferrous iron transport protein B [Sedimentisphaerales bacterium]
MSQKINVAIAGNPNSGKTTIFNALTGARQHVGNYPGVTVEKREGTCSYKGLNINIVDLPGTYSLTAYSTEEIVARDYIIDQHPDVVIDIIDASNIERNLFLATQLMEMNVPLVLVFNMSDIARQKGFVFDTDKLSVFFGAPIVMTVGNRSKGIDQLLSVVVKTALEGPPAVTGSLSYGDEIENELTKIQSLLDVESPLVKKYGKRWLATKLIEWDKEIVNKIASEPILAAVGSSREHLRKIFGDQPQILIADRRYGYISGACQEAVKTTTELRHDMSDRVDAVLTNRVLGLPIFICLMYIIFQLTFSLGKYPMGWLENLFEWLSVFLTSHWPGPEDSQLLSLVVDGVIAGVGGVIVFLPNILLLFLAISILEDSGYMSRAAFIMDQIMHKIGLHGKSFIPMLIGFGCSVPAIMATRILENRRSRLTTMMVIPLFSCGARLPIYALMIPAFFEPRLRGPMLFLIYFIGIVLAIVLAKLLRNTLFRGETMPFVMELPPYRMPTLRGVLIHMWHRAWMYIKKAGTIILGISIILWAATTYPKIDETSLTGMDAQLAQKTQVQYSVVGRIGATIEPAMRPLGFDWRVSTALVGAFAAKEVFVSQLGILYSMGEVDETSETLREHLIEDYTSLQGFCIMIFCLINMPCVATIAMTRQESGSWKWAIFQGASLTVLAYIITLTIYQVGLLFVS